MTGYLRQAFFSSTLVRELMKLRRIVPWPNCLERAVLLARRAFSLLLFVRLMMVPAWACAAGSNEEGARAAYDDAAAAYDAKDFAVAAADFALADELAPNPSVLNLALAAAVRADLAELAMSLVLKAEARDMSDSMLDLVRISRERFASRVGYLRVLCSPLRACTATVAGHALAIGAVGAYAPGALEVTFNGIGGVSSRSVNITAGQPIELSEPELPMPTLIPSAARQAAARSPAPVSPSLVAGDSGLPREVFWGGVGLSAALVAATVASGLDTVHARQAFLDNRTEETRNHAQATVVRSNVLLTATLVSALGSTLIGLVYTRWQNGSDARARSRSPLSPVLVF